MTNYGLVFGEVSENSILIAYCDSLIKQTKINTRKSIIECIYYLNCGFSVIFTKMIQTLNRWCPAQLT